MGISRVILGVAAVALTAIATAEAAPLEIGQAELVVEDVTAALAAENRRLAPADPVRFGEVIATGADSASVIALADSTQIAIGERARVTLDEFVYQPGGDGGRMALSLMLGTFRFVTGVMPKPAYVIRTPSTTITVRGTVFALNVAADGTTTIEVEEGEIEATDSAGNSIAVAAGQSVSLGASAAGGLPGGMGFSGMGPGDLAALHAKIARMDSALSAAAGNTGPGGDLSRALGSARADAIGKQPPGSTPPGPSTPGASTPGSARPGSTATGPAATGPAAPGPAGSEIGKANRGPAGKGKPGKDHHGKGAPDHTGLKG